MSKDKKQPSADRLKSSVKDAIGKLTGDVRVETEGKGEKRRTKPERTPPKT
ncbi:CsbD family protein [Methylobacterium planeticum]|uniref:CsbD family protein n=1 Tax=Methylobacterium planeticum TaxID=2615211 RepID=A0A6N6MU35_9HYPH|nr:CsbD family protein [Methylobacterium planeticum]KAB1072263.1 CsbD family protein [Methylobacterium planeticum]